MKRSVAVLLAGFLAAPALGQSSQPAAPPPCSGPEHRTLDFWVGEWIVEWDQQGQIPAGTGTNRITRDEFGSCVITEHFQIDGGGFKGFSVSTYRPGLKQWRQTWVDDQGGFFDLVGGPVSGADHVFVLENKRVSENQPFQRMIWQDVKPDSLTWRWQRRTRADEPWADSWVIRYRRKPAAAAAQPAK